MKDHTIYTGIVIQNNDPDKMGRVKVYVPGITNTVYDNWNNTIENKEFSFIDGSLLAILEQLKEDLPWCECAQGLMGGGTTQLNDKETPIPLVRPSDDKVASPPMDAFDKSVYTPGDYSGTAGGHYTIPNVGTHVYVMFKQGNTSFPVYFGTAHSKAEWQDVFKKDYPTDYENSNVASEPYQNKHVINTNKHTLEFIDTDDTEEIRMSHFSGSNIQMLNDYNSTYAVKDSYELVEEHKYATVKKTSNTNVGETVNLEVGQTINVVVGGGTTIVVNGDGSITVDASTSLTITTPTTNINGNVNVDGDVNITGTSTASVDHVSAGISGATHTHEYITPQHPAGPAPTAPPS